MSRKCLAAVCAAWTLIAGAVPLAAQRWEVQYFYDKGDSRLQLVDLQFPSAARGVAVGVIETKSSRKNVAVVTSDGGSHWEMVPLREPPVSLFFLSENLGWLVTTKGIWVTNEAGKSWRKLENSPRKVLRVHFLDENTGFAVGIEETVLVTRDGGRHWKPVPEAGKSPGQPRYTDFTWIAFATPRLGIISGRNVPPDPRRPQHPGWMDPEATVKHAELPHLSIALQTGDGGETWTPSSSSTFGSITRVRFAGPGPGVSLIEYADSFRFPSEVFGISWPGGRSETIYRDPDCAITDVWLTPGGKCYLAGIRHRGRLRSGVPGKLQVIQRDAGVWRYMDVDYRAEADRAVLAGYQDQLWVATDSGMILKLVEKPSTN